MTRSFVFLLVAFFMLTITDISGQTTPCNLTGGSVYLDYTTTPGMMNASVNGVSIYDYTWNNGISGVNQMAIYPGWCVLITDLISGCDTTICENCIPDTLALCPCPMIYMPVCGCDGIQYANSCIAICAGVGWTPAVPNGQLGGFLPCTSPSWDCNPGQGCYDPGTGLGAYSSLAACQSNCSITPSWDCHPVQGCFDPGTGLGQYTTYSACDTVCSTVNPSWDCINGACIDPLTGQGAYTNYNACVSACIMPSWDCINGSCIDPGTGLGSYTSYNACNVNCIAPTWDCVNNFCFDPGTGQGAYTTYSACTSACMIPLSWDCDGQGTCYDPGTGQGAYSSLSACNAICVSNSITEENSRFLIYPNPTQNILTIDGDYTSVIIYDVFGKVMITSDSQNNIDVSSLSNGIYFISINTNNSIAVKRITIAN